MVALVATAGAGRPSKEIRELLEKALRAIFTDLDAARAVGRVHLAGDPGAAESALRLARALAAAAEKGRGPQAVRREIVARREREWRAGEVVLVGGWVLARTEADLCALALAG